MKLVSEDFGTESVCSHSERLFVFSDEIGDQAATDGRSGATRPHWKTPQECDEMERALRENRLPVLGCGKDLSCQSRNKFHRNHDTWRVVISWCTAKRRPEAARQCGRSHDHRFASKSQRISPDSNRAQTCSTKATWASIRSTMLEEKMGLQSQRW